MSNNIYIKYSKVQSNSDISKSISLKNGKLVKTANAMIYDGEVKMVSQSWQDFRNYLSSMPGQECILLGKSVNGDCQLTTEKNADGTKSFGRTLENFKWHQEYQLLCFDYDGTNTKDISPDDFIGIIDKVLPGFKDIKKIIRYSSSAWIYSGDELVSKSNGFHIYFLVNNPDKIKEIFSGNDSTLHKKLWLEGHGYIKNSEPKDPQNVAVQQYERTIYDNAIFSPERIIFEGSPILEDGLVKRKQEADLIGETDFLDLEKVKNISKLEQAEYNDLVKREKNKNAKSKYYLDCKQLFESNTLLKVERGDFKQRISYKGLLSEEIVSREWQASNRGYLVEDSRILLEGGSSVTVKEILADKVGYHLVECFDPCEPEYSKAPIARIYSNQDVPVIRSFAHGGQTFYLEWEEVDNFESPDYWLNHMYHNWYDGKNQYLHISGNTIDIMSKEGFKDRFAGYHNKEVNRRMSDWWLERTDKKSISGEGFYPGKPIVYQERGQNKLNSYIPEILKKGLDIPTHEEAERAAGPWVKHIRDMIGDDADVVLDWFAYLIQEPDERPMWAPLICSETKGVGKDTIIDIFSGCIGSEYVRRVPLESLINPNYWGDAFYKSKVIAVSECGGSKEKYSVNDMLKSAVTDATKNLNLKGKAIVNSPVFCGIILFSNSINPFKIEHGERRFFATRCDWTRVEVLNKENSKYFKLLRDFYKDDVNLNGLYHYLMGREIRTNLKGVAPETQFFRDIVDSSLSAVDRFFQDLENHPCKFWTREMISRLFENHVGDMFDNKGQFEYYFKKVMVTTESVRIDGNVTRLKTWSQFRNSTSEMIKENKEINWGKTTNTLHPNTLGFMDRFVKEDEEVMV